MAYNRVAVVNYAKRYWNRPCDDGRIETRGGPRFVSEIKANTKGATGPDWEAFFADDGYDTGVIPRCSA